MSSIEIVSHCYCPPGFDHYAEMLKWQFSSLELYPPNADVTLSVCYTETDTATTAALQQIAELASASRSGARVKCLNFEPGELFRRAIGRNFVALETDADVVWFTDIDYLFGPECLATVADLVGPDDGLVIPAAIWIHRDHATGDADVEQYRLATLKPIPFHHFVERRQKIAIGGCHIVGGNTARRVGYCKQSPKYMEPVDPSFGFRSCRCDRAFRKLNNFEAKRLKIPNVFRMRHTVDGRDYDLTGGKGEGKTNW